MEHESLFNILMILAVKKVGYCYKYTCSTYDCFVVPGSQIVLNHGSDISLHITRLFERYFKGNLMMQFFLRFVKELCLWSVTS